MASVAVGEPGLVAVGHEDEWGGVWVVWTSPDGIIWHQTAGEYRGRGGRMSAVAAGGPGFVAAGYNDDSVALWTSGDGLTWARVRDSENVFEGAMPGGTTRVAGIATSGGALVVVGYDEMRGGDAGVSWRDRDAAVWISDDGLTWARVADDENTFSGDGHQDMTAVAAGVFGFVAVGTYGEAVAVWTSLDGLTWTRVPYDDAVFGGGGDNGITSVVAGGPGLIAVGSDGDDAAVWVWMPNE